jgi:hypothetical protein
MHPMNPTKLCTHIPPGEAWFGYDAGFSPDLPRSYKGHPDPPDAEAMNCVMLAIPPGLVFRCSGDYSSFICIQPEAVDPVRVKMGLMFFGPARDKAVLTAMIRGLKSNHYSHGPLAQPDYEGAALDLAHNDSRRMSGPLIAGCRVTFATTAS